MNLFLSGYLLKPYVHTLVFVAVTLAVFGLLRQKDADGVYTVAGIAYGAFILTNSVLMYLAQSSWSYFFTSLLFSITYIIAIAIVSTIYIRIAKIPGSGESAMVFLIILYHPAVLLLVMAVKWAVSRI